MTTRFFRVALLTALCCAFYSYPSVGAAEAIEGEDGLILIEAGLIENDRDAEERCPEVVEEWHRENPDLYVEWTGQWQTVVPGEISVCACEQVAGDGGEAETEQVEAEAENESKWVILG